MAILTTTATLTDLPSGTVSVLNAVSTTITMPTAMTSTDYRVHAQFVDLPIMVWVTNQTTTTFDLQFSATATGKVSYEVTA